MSPILFPLILLQLLHKILIFLTEWVPPLLKGIMWSYSRFSVLPHKIHLPLSLFQTFFRISLGICLGELSIIILLLILSKIGSIEDRKLSTGRSTTVIRSSRTSSKGRSISTFKILKTFFRLYLVLFSTKFLNLSSSFFANSMIFSVLSLSTQPLFSYSLLTFFTFPL